MNPDARSFDALPSGRYPENVVLAWFAAAGIPHLLLAARSNWYGGGESSNPGASGFSGRYLLLHPVDGWFSWLHEAAHWIVATDRDSENFGLPDPEKAATGPRRRREESDACRVQFALAHALKLKVNWNTVREDYSWESCAPQLEVPRGRAILRRKAEGARFLKLAEILGTPGSAVKATPA